MASKHITHPIFITGIERSGSSIIARILKACGAFTGQTTEMCENTGIKHLVDNYYRYTLKMPVNGQDLPLNTNIITNIPNWFSYVTFLLKNEGYDETIPWIYKNCRIAQIWPLWNRHFPEAKYIIVRRRTGDVVQSCMKTGYMKACSTEDGWLEWIHKQERFFIEMNDEGLNCTEVWPERMAQGDFEQMKQLVSELGLQWSTEVEDMVKVLMRNSKQV